MGNLTYSDNSTYKLPRPSALAMPAGDADRLITLGSGSAALLYIYALRSGEGFSLAGAAQALRLSEPELRKAAELLSAAGLLEAASKARAPLPLPAEETPEYTAADIIARTAESDEFRAIVEETQHILGHTLSSPDLKILFELYDSLRLPAEVIFLLLNHCTEEAKLRGGPGARVSMKAIQKEGYYWFNHEIITLDRVEEHLQRCKARRSDMNELKRVFQISSRDYTEGERAYVESWLDMGFSLDAIALAYDRTVLKTGKLAWKYMDTILQSWHAKGLHTVSAVQSGDKPPLAKGAGAKPGAPVSPGGADDSQLLRQMLRKAKERD